jgi:hypothetical protein
VLIVVPTSVSMGCGVGDAQPCAAPPPAGGSRMDAVKLALADLFESLHAEGVGVNVGLMRARNDGGDSRGGFVALDAAPIDHVYSGPFAGFPGRSLEQALDVICPPGRDGCTLVGPAQGAGPGVELLELPDHPAFVPAGAGRQRVAEVLFEAYRYYAGLAPHQGGDSRIGPGYAYPGDLAGDGSDEALAFFPPVMTQPGCQGADCRYRSPIQGACQDSHIVLISDGVLADDTGADGLIGLDAGNPTRVWFRNYVDPAPQSVAVGGKAQASHADDGAGTCSDNVIAADGADAPGDCADDLAHSLRLGGWHPTHAGARVITHTIGFDLASSTQATGQSAASATARLELLARAGGGTHRLTQNRAGLFAALRSVIDKATVQHASFTAPAAPVDAFNRTRNLGDVYVSVFRPSPSQRWRGNVKKYRIGPDGSILGRNGQPAADPSTGLFLPGASSLCPCSQNSSTATTCSPAARRAACHCRQNAAFTRTSTAPTRSRSRTTRSGSSWTTRRRQPPSAMWQPVSSRRPAPRTLPRSLIRTLRPCASWSRGCAARTSPIDCPCQRATATSPNRVTTSATRCTPDRPS